MQASKESCLAALVCLDTAFGLLQAKGATVDDFNHALSCLESVSDFLQSAGRKLPTNEAIQRDRAKKRTNRANSKPTQAGVP